MREPHVVPLSQQALALLKGLKMHRTGKYVFFGYKRKPIARSGCWVVCHRVTEGRGSPHGWRAALRSWCADNGVAREIAESALAHKVGGVEAAYNRASLVERRKPVMQAWADYLTGEGESEAVVPFRGKRR